MPVAQPRLLRRKCFEKFPGFFFSHSTLQVHVPLRILEIDADLALPFRREEVLILLRRFVRSHELCVIAHRVEQRMDIDPMALRIFETLVVGCGLVRNKFLCKPGFFQELELKTGGSKNVHRVAACSRLVKCALQDSFAGRAVKGRFDERVLFLECIDQSDDLLVVQRAVEDDLALGFGGVFDRCRLGSG